MQYKIKKISGDASFREFYKIEKINKSTILVKANKDKFKNLIVYAAINSLLIKNKIKAPKLVQEYCQKYDGDRGSRESVFLRIYKI